MFFTIRKACFLLFEFDINMDFIIWYTGLIILIIAWLLINRHIIWWVGYNFFPPIIIGYAINMVTLSYERTSIIIISTILWRLATKVITNYINLSLYPRYWLYIIMSLWIFISIWNTYTQYFFHSLTTNQSENLMFLFLIIAAMSIKTYSWWKWLFSPLWWGHIVRFFILSFVINKIFQWEYIYTYFMNHGVIVILLGLFTIMIWSYTGLQIKEMIRFRKLIWNKITNKKKRG